MEIVLLQKCGLGNQLFQYAAARFYAAQYGARFEVIRDGRVPEWEVKKREFLLAHFNIAAPVRDLQFRDRLLSSSSSWKAPAAAPARALTRTHVYTQPWQLDRTFCPDLGIPRDTARLYLDGFFQAWQYAAHDDAALRQEFSLREPATGRNVEFLGRIQQSQCPVSIHVRRGDYTVHNRLLPVSYVLTGMRRMRELLVNPTWVVFSNDIEWARTNLAATEPILFVEGNDEDHGHEDLRLMAACRHHIIANSTFSWWGAWLGKAPDKIVYAPEVWLDPNTPSPDIVPAGWLRGPIR